MAEDIVAQLLELDPGHVVGDLAMADFLADAYLAQSKVETHLTIREEHDQCPGDGESGREKYVPALIDPYVEEAPTGDDIVPNSGKVKDDDQEYQHDDNHVR